jgi:hypothetical protein
LLKSITTINKDCFIKCFQLNQIDFPAPVKKLNEGCFYEYPSLTQIFLLQSIQTISKDCFSGYFQFNQINIHVFIKEFDTECFNESYSLAQFFCFNQP